jgi:hypothetical protein
MGREISLWAMGEGDASTQADVNGYPLPVYPRVKTLLGCEYGGTFPPTGDLVGDSFPR